MTNGCTKYVLIYELRRIGWPANKRAISAPVSAAIQCGRPAEGVVTKQKDEAIRSLPKRLSNATLSLPVVTWTSVQAKARKSRRKARKSRRKARKHTRAYIFVLPDHEPLERSKALAWKALHALFSDHKIPNKSAAELLRMVNKWLNDHGHHSVSPSTLQRVLGRKT